jgi:hypothetical protein
MGLLEGPWKSLKNGSSTALPNIKQTQALNKCNKHVLNEYIR